MAAVPVVAISLFGPNVIVREGLRRIFSEAGFDVVQSGADPQAVRPHGGDAPHLVVLDYGGRPAPIFRMSSLPALRERCPSSHVVMLADRFDFAEMMSAFANGAQGYIVKEISCDPLVASLRLAAVGEKVMPSHLADVLPRMSENRMLRRNVADVGERLSERESTILECLALGMSNKLISRRVAISEATVKVHVKAILRKLNVVNRTQAAIVAMGGELPDACSEPDVAIEQPA